MSIPSETPHHFPPAIDCMVLSTDSTEVAALKQAWRKDRDEFAKARRELAWAKLKIQVLEEQRRKLLLAKYGPSSEKLSDDQLRLLELEPGVSQEEVQAEAGRDAEELAHRPKRTRKPHPGRQTLPADLPRVEEIVPLPAAQCLRGACGNEMPVIGYEESGQLDVKPAEYFVRLAKREKRACGACGKGGVKTAPVAPSIIGKCLVSDRIVLDTVLAKYLDHLLVELPNNLAENSMRGIALGRKNWIHLGDQAAGPRVAAILSIAETCRRLQLPVREYLLDVLPGMADRKRSEVPSLTPTRWKAARA